MGAFRTLGDMLDKALVTLGGSTAIILIIHGLLTFIGKIDDRLTENNRRGLDRNGKWK